MDIKIVQMDNPYLVKQNTAFGRCSTFIYVNIFEMDSKTFSYVLHE